MKDPETFERKTVDNTTFEQWKGHYIVPHENLRRRTQSDGKEIIDKATYHKLTKKFIANGGIIVRGELARKHLEDLEADASYMVGSNMAFIVDDPRVSDVLEEMYHAEQDRRNMFNKDPWQIKMIKREIDAQKYLLKVADKYKIPVEETEQTKKALQDYEEKLVQILGGDDNDR